MLPTVLSKYCQTFKTENWCIVIAEQPQNTLFCTCNQIYLNFLSLFDISSQGFRLLPNTRYKTAHTTTITAMTLLETVAHRGLLSFTSCSLVRRIRIIKNRCSSIQQSIYARHDKTNSLISNLLTIFTANLSQQY